jgi:hypothetical protein
MWEILFKAQISRMSEAALINHYDHSFHMSWMSCPSFSLVSMTWTHSNYIFYCRLNLHSLVRRKYSRHGSLLFKTNKFVGEHYFSFRLIFKRKTIWEPCVNTKYYTYLACAYCPHFFLFKVWHDAKVILKVIPNCNRFDPIFINASLIFLVFLKSTQLGMKSPNWG